MPAMKKLKLKHCCSNIAGTACSYGDISLVPTVRRSSLYTKAVIPAWTAGIQATWMYKDYHPWHWISASRRV
jgi:hypothetical protein